MFDKKYILEDYEKEKQNLDWALPSSQLCLLIYTTSSRTLLIFDALQPLSLSGEEERLLYDNFTSTSQPTNLRLS